MVEQKIIKIYQKKKKKKKSHICDLFPVDFQFFPKDFHANCVLELHWSELEVVGVQLSTNLLKQVKNKGKQIKCKQNIEHQTT